MVRSLDFAATAAAAAAALGMLSACSKLRSLAVQGDLTTRLASVYLKLKELPRYDFGTSSYFPQMFARILERRFGVNQLQLCARIVY